jgi:hypothetical protein
MLCLAALVFHLSCDKNNLKAISPCVMNWIEEVKQGPVWNSPARVYEYRYNQKTVYLTTVDAAISLIY